MPVPAVTLTRHQPAQATATPLGARPLELWHLLSLDAPTVATLWTWFFARVAGVHLPALTLVAMFLAVWTLYAADRLLDARPLRAVSPANLPLQSRLHALEARHRFHHRHRRAFLLALAPVSLSLGLLLPTLDPAAIRLDLVLGSLLIGYFILIHATSSRVPKELAVGIFFAAAVFIPTVARRPDLRLTLLPLALLFAALCSLNCLTIYAWEHPSRPSRATLRTTSQPLAPHPHLHHTEPASHPLTRLAVRHLRPLHLVLLTAATLLLLHNAPATHLPALAIALAATGLLALQRRHPTLAPTTLRALVDLVLLTPLLLLPWLPR